MHHHFERPTHLAPTAGALPRLDARIKLVGALTLLALATGIGHPLAPASVTALGVLMLLGLRQALRPMLSRLLLALLAVTVLVTMQIFVSEGPALWHTRVLGLELRVTPQGLDRALHTGLRVLAGLVTMLALAASTPWPTLLGALRALGVPLSLIELLGLSYRHTFTLLHSAREIRTAQTLRLGLSGLGRSLRSSAELAGLVLLRAFERAEQTAQAMTLRASTGMLPVPTLPRLRAGQRALVAGLLILSGAVVLHAVLEGSW